MIRLKIRKSKKDNLLNKNNKKTSDNRTGKQRMFPELGLKEKRNYVRKNERNDRRTVKL